MTKQNIKKKGLQLNSRLKKTRMTDAKKAEKLLLKSRRLLNVLQMELNMHLKNIAQLKSTMYDVGTVSEELLKSQRLLDILHTELNHHMTGILQIKEEHSAAEIYNV